MIVIKYHAGLRQSQPLVHQKARRVVQVVRRLCAVAYGINRLLVPPKLSNQLTRSLKAEVRCGNLPLTVTDMPPLYACGLYDTSGFPPPA